MKLYLCCGNKSGVEDPDEWVGVDIQGGDITADVRTLKPQDFSGLTFVFATPPCNGFTDLPWRPATGEGLDVLLATKAFCEASGVPWVLECNRFAQKHIGPADFHRGPHYFWTGNGGGTIMAQFTRRKGRISGKDPLARARLPTVLLEEACCGQSPECLDYDPVCSCPCHSKERAA